MTEFNKKMVHIFAWGFLVFSMLFSATIGALIYNDFKIDPPFNSIKATSLNPVKPGSIAVIQVVYTRDISQNMRVIDRWLTCEDGTQWDVPVYRQVGAFPAGEELTGEIRFKVPENLTPGQTCYYGSKVVYDRVILSDLFVRTPPVDVPVEIK